MGVGCKGIWVYGVGCKYSPQYLAGSVSTEEDHVLQPIQAHRTHSLETVVLYVVQYAMQSVVKYVVQYVVVIFYCNL